MNIGIIGGGQLARMLALAGHTLGLKTICLDPVIPCAAAPVASVLAGNYHHKSDLLQLARHVEVITYEFENIPASFLSELKTPVFPAPSILRIAQDRLQEKRCFERLGIPTTHYHPVESLAALREGIEKIGMPALLKTRSLGYDGKGQYEIQTLEDIGPAWEVLGASDPQPRLILENKVYFDREISCLAVRGVDGEILFYDLVENDHQKGILRRSKVVSFEQEERLNRVARTYVSHILNAFEYVGVLTVEFFQKGETLLANEMAPRVHNSGHWTIEGADTSQFENHLRAICHLPLGATTTRGKVGMLNMIGVIPPLHTILKIPQTHYHVYGKHPRPGRKLGHVTVWSEDADAFENAMAQLTSVLMGMEEAGESFIR